MGAWSDTAWAVMTNKLLECQAAGMSREETAKVIDEAYPFGQRSRTPYRAWLNVRRDFFARYGLPRKGDYKTQKDRLNDLVAQMAAADVGVAESRFSSNKPVAASR